MSDLLRFNIYIDNTEMITHILLNFLEAYKNII